jgi:hypothetical protein
MDKAKKIFPLSFRGASLKDMVIGILIYMAINVVSGLVLGLLNGIPLIGMVFTLAAWLISFYTFAGIVFTVLNYVGGLSK